MFKTVRTQLSHLASLAKSLSVRLRIKWFWVQFQLQSLKRKLVVEEKLLNHDRKLSDMCGEFFEDFQKEIKEEIFKELVDGKCKTTKL